MFRALSARAVARRATFGYVPITTETLRPDPNIPHQIPLIGLGLFFIGYDSQVPVEDAADDDAGWVIQLGSFRHEKNVKALLAKLEKAGYRAFSRKIQTSSGPLNKVFVGPDLDKKKLESALPHLKELTSLKGKVTTFKVE